LVSYSKKPPQRFTALGKVIETASNVIDFHYSGIGGDTKRGRMVARRVSSESLAGGGNLMRSAL
jgi:hypothetical protein